MHNNFVATNGQPTVFNWYDWYNCHGFGGLSCSEEERQTDCSEFRKYEDNGIETQNGSRGSDGSPGSPGTPGVPGNAGKNTTKQPDGIPGGHGVPGSIIFH